MSGGEPTAGRARRLYRRLLRLLPFDLRWELGGEMEAVFAEQRSAAARRGRLALARLWWDTLRDLAATAPREHWDVLRRDLVYAWRMLRRTPAVSVVAVATLALGIGANTAVFSLVEAVLLRPLPYPETDRLMRLAARRPSDADASSVSLQEAAAWSERARSFTAITAWETRSGNLVTPAGPQRVRYAVVTPGFLTVFGVPPALGRGFAASEELPGRGAVAVVSDGFWRRYLGGERTAPGSGLTLNGERLTVVGVMPPGFRDASGEETELWKPLAFGSDDAGEGRWLRAAGRLAPGVSLAAAGDEMAALAAALAEERPAAQRGWEVAIAPLAGAAVAAVRPVLLALWGAVGLVLLLACTNLANLLLARATARRGEIAVRLALGARRARLVRQLLSESLLLAAAGGAAGLGVALAGVRLIPLAGGAELPRAAAAGLSPPVLVFALALTLIAGLATGLAPALRLAGEDPGPALEKRTGGSGRRRRRGRSLLVAAEVAVALVVLVGAGLLLRSLAGVLAVDPGFDPERLLTLRLEPPTRTDLSGEPDAAALARYFAEQQAEAGAYSRLLERLEALPGVRSAAAVNRRPLAGPWWGTEVWAEEGPVPPPGEELLALSRVITPGYYATAGIPLIAGRPLAPRDAAGAQRSVVVSQSLARSLWPGDEPLGRRLATDRMGDDTWYTVVGVVGDVRHSRLDEAPRPTLYRTMAQARGGFFMDWGMDLLVRSAGDPAALAPAVRRAVAEERPELPVFDVAPMRRVIGVDLAERRFVALLLALFAATALLLAALGIYGVVAYSVGLRAHEIGVRLALGERRRGAVARIVRGAMAPVAAGVAAGLAAAAGLSRLLASQLYGIGATDPSTYAGVALLLAAVALAACWLPARRAARIDPAATFRRG